MAQDIQITRLLSEWRAGDQSAFDALSDVVYAELRQIAGRLMVSERSNHTLQPTALVNEAFLSLVDAKVSLTDRQHFYALAARIMRRTLVDHARGKQALKRGGDLIAVTLNTSIGETQNLEDILELDDALTRLADKDSRLAQAVELIYFGGLTYEQTADELGVSRTALVEDLTFAKAWMRRAMG